MKTTITRLTFTALAALSVTAAQAAVWYVSENATGDGSSWTTAAGDLQETIDAASAGDEIWIKAGTYRPSRLIKSSKKTSKAFFLKDGVSLYGGFAGGETSLADRKTADAPYDMINPTVLSADDEDGIADVWQREPNAYTPFRWSWQTGSDNNVTGTASNSSHVLYCNDTFTRPTVIDGLTLTGGNANVATAKPHGGALYALGTVILRNSRIIENSAYFTAEANDCNTYGGAIYLNGGEMRDCLVEKAFAHSSYGNGYGGGVYADNAVIERCSFSQCVGLDGGGAVYLKGGSLTDCTFNECYGAKGGAVLNDGGTVARVTVTEGSGLLGGGIYNKGTLTDAWIGNCYADAPEYSTMGGKGGALYNESGNAAGIVAINSRSFEGGGVYLDGGRLINATVQHNLSRDDTPDNILINTGEVLNSITATDVAMSNFVAPTTFSGPTLDASLAAAIAASDWHLAPGSEYIDAGTPVEGYTSTDIAGNPRVTGSGIDCGAYETQGDVRVPTVTLTFADGTQAARIGVGGATGYEFTIDWGDGVEVKYDQQQYISHLITGNTVRIYGDDIVVLNANSQSIVTADVSRATDLIQLQLTTNGLESLALGSHPSMTGIYAYGNRLKSIDLSGCPSLRVIDLHENAIEGSVDCSAMNALSKIDVADNLLTSVTFPKHSTLYEIDCSNNHLESLDVAGLGGLDELAASGNRLSAVDLSGLTAMTSLYLGENQISTIDISPCSSIETIQLAENSIRSIDLSANSTLSGVYLQDNKLETLDITANPNVRWLNIANNNVAALDVSAQKYLSILIASGNAIKSIDLSNNTSLSNLNLEGNALSSIDVSKASYLSQFNVANNNLTALDVKANKYLYGLFCGGNALTELDITANTYLQRLEAQGNSLTSIDLSANTGLQQALLQSNKMDTGAIDALITALPDVSDVQVTPETESFVRQLNISYMPGTAAADTEAAIAKGWFVTADYDRPHETAVTSLNIQINRAGDRVVEVDNATIEYSDDTRSSLYIQDFMGFGARIVAPIDADGNIKIAPQVCGGDSDGNYYMIVNSESTGGNPMAIYNTYVSGHFDGTTLSLEPWNMIVVPYTFNENLGTVFPADLTSEFVMANGTMDYTLASGTALTQNIYSEVDTDNNVAVYGWGEYAAVTLSRENGMWRVNTAEPACEIDGTEYFVRAADGTTLVSASVPDARTLVFGAWQLAPSARATALRDATSATLRLGHDLPVMTGIAMTRTDIVSRTYTNAAGLRADRPFAGFNIVTTVYSDGSVTNHSEMR